MTTAILTVSELRGQTERKFQLQVGASYAKNVAGTDQARRKLEPKGVTLGSSFFMHGKTSMVNRAGLPKGCAGPLVRFLVDPHGSPPVIDQETDGDCKPQSLEDSTMAQATSMGEIRPNHTASEIRLVNQGTVVKRIRRKLAERGHYLQITRAGTDARQELGEYCVLDNRFVPLTTDCKLDELARFLGVLDKDELIDTPHGRGWVHQVVRLTTVNGCIYSTPISRTYTTVEAAKRAATKFTGEDVAVHSWDAEVCAKGGTKNA